MQEGAWYIGSDFSSSANAQGKVAGTLSRAHLQPALRAVQDQLVKPQRRAVLGGADGGEALEQLAGPDISLSKARRAAMVSGFS